VRAELHVPSRRDLRPRERVGRRVATNWFFLDARTARATWTILVFVGVLGLAYVLRNVLLLAALSLLFAYLLFPLVRLTQRWVIGHRPLAIVVVHLVVLGRARRGWSPALVIVGVLAGGEIAGVAGMFLSVPIIAAARIVWRRLSQNGGGAAPAATTGVTDGSRRTS
jgi:predicted PurR-regulated permease PerM